MGPGNPRRFRDVAPGTGGAAVPDHDSIGMFRRLVGEDPVFQHRVWAAQRIGWAVMGAVVLFALAGGLGDGPLSTAEATSADGALRVGHDRVARQDSSTRWDITLPPGAREVTIRSEALPWAEVASIAPIPSRQTRGETWLTLRFDTASLVTLTIQPQRPGTMRVDVAAGSSVAEFGTLVLP